jgi:hypothetical protein
VISRRHLSGFELTLDVGRDVTIASKQVINNLVLDGEHTSSDITQIGAAVSAGRDLLMRAGVTSMPSPAKSMPSAKSLLPPPRTSPSAPPPMKITLFVMQKADRPGRPR